jgi:thiol-disulfide isomerase/thioredoxin
MASMSVTGFLTLWLTTVGVAQMTHAGQKDAKSYPVLSGVGIALQSEEGQLFVGKVVPHSPADKSGRIHTGDRLVSVETDGHTTPLDGKTIGEAASIIRGPVDTDVTLTLAPKNSDTTYAVTLTREPLELAGVPASSYGSFIGKAASDLRLSSLHDQSTIKLSDLRGRIVVLDFWASWCPTCYAPVTEMQEIASRNPDWDSRVELITVSVDSDRARAAETVQKQGWNKTRNMVLDLEGLKYIGVTVVPVVVVIDTDGRIKTMAGSHAVDIETEVTRLLM